VRLGGGCRCNRTARSGRRQNRVADQRRCPLAELQKLGIEIAETTVAKYLGRRPSSSPTWRTFLRTHLSQCASMDFFTVPTATFRVLFVLVSGDQIHREALRLYVDFVTDSQASRTRST
jgi:hypothetical protein